MTNRLTHLRTAVISLLAGAVLALIVTGFHTGTPADAAGPHAATSSSTPAAFTATPSASPSATASSTASTTSSTGASARTAAADVTVQRAWLGSLYGLLDSTTSPQIAGAAGLDPQLAQLRAAAHGHRVQLMLTHATVTGMRGSATLVTSVDGHRAPATTVSFVENARGWQLTRTSFCDAIGAVGLGC